MICSVHGQTNRSVIAYHLLREPNFWVPLYAAPAWSGFLSETDTNRLQSVIKKAKRFGYLPSSFCNLFELCADADEKLFFSVR